MSRGLGDVYKRQEYRYHQQYQEYSQMIMIQQLIQHMVHQINIDLVYDIQFETNITKMDEKLITKQFVKDPSGQCKRENQ